MLYVDTIHPFVMADILEVPRHSRHEKDSRRIVALFQQMLGLAETLGIIAGRTPDCSDERYQISLSQTTTLRRQFAQQTGDLRTDLATPKQRERTKHLCQTLNALVYLGVITGIPGKYDWLPRTPWTPIATAHPMPLSHWLAVHSDAKGFALGQPFSTWPTGQPTCFTVFIPDCPSEGGGTTLAAVNVENDLYSTEKAPQYSDLACALVDARHLAAHGTLELIVARELDPAAADCVLVDCGAKHPVSIPAQQLLAMLSPSSKDAVLHPQAA